MSRRCLVVVTVAVVAGLTLGGCVPRQPAAPPPSAARPTPAATSGPPTVAWFDAPASPPPPPAVPGARPRARACAPADLAPSAQNEGTSAGTGHRDYRVTVVNVGATPCSLIGTPSLTQRDAAGQTRVVPTLPGPILGDPGIVGYATIDPGEPAWLIIEESETCNGGIDPARYANLSIDADGASISVPVAVLESTCPIRVSTWYRPDEVGYRPPNRFGLVEVELTGPDTVKRGHDLVFIVTLAQYRSPIPLDPCPVYTETFGSLSASYRLNCDPPTLGTGRTRFEMRLAVPGDVPTGPTRLDWHFDEPGARTNAGNGATVTVV